MSRLEVKECMYTDGELMFITQGQASVSARSQTGTFTHFHVTLTNDDIGQLVDDLMQIVNEREVKEAING